MGRSKRTEEAREAFLASARENVVPDMGLILQYVQEVITDITDVFQPFNEEDIPIIILSLTLVENTLRRKFPEAAACADDMTKFTAIACVEKNTTKSNGVMSIEK